MKKLKRFVLRSGINCLTDFEQMNLIGGSEALASCAGKIQSQCSGQCTDSYGDDGECVWAGGDLNACYCATVTVEPPTMEWLSHK